MAVTRGNKAEQNQEFKAKSSMYPTVMPALAETVTVGCLYIIMVSFWLEVTSYELHLNYIHFERDQSSIIN